MNNNKRVEIIRVAINHIKKTKSYPKSATFARAGISFSTVSRYFGSLGSLIQDLKDAKPSLFKGVTSKPVQISNLELVKELVKELA